MPRPAWIGIVFLGILHLFLGWEFILSSAPTFDEPVHLASGFTSLETGRYRLNIYDHPPFAEMWAALPWYLAGRLIPSWVLQTHLNHPYWLSGQTYHYADLFLYHNRLPADRILNLSRLFGLFSWTALLLIFLARWASELGGWPAAAWTCFLFALTPAFLSNDALVTTDAASAAFYFAACFCFNRAVAGGSRRLLWSAAAGGMTGLALGSKFNMALLPAVLAVFWVWTRWRQPEQEAKNAQDLWGMKVLGLWIVCSSLTLALVYRGAQLPLYLKGLEATARRLGEGRSSFLIGDYSTNGFWLYFPVAFLIKTPIPLLVLGLGALLSAIFRREFAPIGVVMPMGAYFAAALTSRVQIGYRHLLPVIPFFVLLAGVFSAWLWQRKGYARCLVAALGLWQAASVARARPYYLAYFNEAVGGPASGYRYLVDSNLDWGQELKGLKQELSRLGNPPVYLSYFGMADPSFYRISYVPLLMTALVERPGDPIRPALARRVYLAVSVTNLQAVYFSDRHVWDWLKPVEPVRKIGYAIFLYDLTGSRRGLEGLANLFKRLGNNLEAQALFRRAAAV